MCFTKGTRQQVPKLSNKRRHIMISYFRYFMFYYRNGDCFIVGGGVYLFSRIFYSRANDTYYNSHGGVFPGSFTLNESQKALTMWIYFRNRKRNDSSLPALAQCEQTLDCWLVRVTLVFAFSFLPQNFGKWWGPTNCHFVQKGMQLEWC